jgi:CCR4-NOT transcriptional regulation complex NOT5 subunit
MVSAQGRYGPARGLVDRVQRNLRRAEHFTPPNEKEKERYHNAQHHLSEFDRRLSEGKFDKDKLDEGIDDVKNVVENNTLSPEARDMLTRDLGELRELRRTRGESY